MNEASVTRSMPNTTGLPMVGMISPLWIEPGFASGMQSTLVPPLAYQGFGLEAYGESIPVDEVGGDLVDVVARDNEVIAYVADVSGHGLRAGVLMAMIKTAVRYGLLLGQPVTKLLADLNRVLPSVKQANMFVTFAMLRFDGSGTAEYISAGHVPLLQYRWRQGDVVRHSLPQLPLGLFADAEYATQRISYEAGDVFVLVSDGVVETGEDRNEEFGFAKLEQVLVDSRGLSVAELAKAIYTELHIHGPQQDDQTVLLVRASKPGATDEDAMPPSQWNRTAESAESLAAEWEKLLDGLAADLSADLS